MLKKGFFHFNPLKTMMKFSGIDAGIRLAAKMARHARQSSMKTGIKSRLKTAGSAQEVADLLVIARGYHGASGDTVRKWQKIGALKLKQFSA
ncbi:MAG: hypothetical protein WC637_12330 [Victivallales bacterium]|jgi:hypothetical protein